jgi:hypothetical protein
MSKEICRNAVKGGDLAGRSSAEGGPFSRQVTIRQGGSRPAGTLGKGGKKKKGPLKVTKQSRYYVVRQRLNVLSKPFQSRLLLVEGAENAPLQAYNY